MKWFRFSLSVMMLGAMGLGITGCNTVKGAGRDIERGGQAIQESAESVRQR